MKYLFIFAAMVAALTYGAIAVEGETWEGGAVVPDSGTSTAKITTERGEIYLHLDSEGRAVVMTGDLAKGSGGSFSTHSTVDRSDRLAELREINKPPPQPKGPETVVIVNQTTNVEIDRESRHRRALRMDRAIHERRRRVARQGYPTPLPSFGIPSHDRGER